MTVIEKLKRDGFDIQDNKILCATPDRVKNFASCGKVFKCIKDQQGNIQKRGWTPVTKKEAIQLKTSIDPVTKRPYLKFAYVPIPKEQLQPESERIDEIDLEFEGFKTSTTEEVPESTEPVKVATKDAGDDSFAALENDQNTEANASAGNDENEDDDKGLTAEDLERRELSGKTVAQLKKIVTDDLGMELPKKVIKADLIEMIVS